MKIDYMKVIGYKIYILQGGIVITLENWITNNSQGCRILLMLSQSFERWNETSRWRTLDQDQGCIILLLHIVVYRGFMEALSMLV